MVIDSKYHCKEIDGLRLPLTFLPDLFRSGVNFKPRKGDIFIASYPKCGTTWLIQIVLLILRKGIPPKTAEEYFSSIPFLEMAGETSTRRMTKPGCIKTHLPFDRLNFTTDPEVKYFYITRHPADCVMSYYYHVQFFPTYFATNKTFDDIFEYFIEGKIIYNDYFDHLFSWYSHRKEPNIFFLTFEELLADSRSLILKIARFLGNDHYNNLISNGEKILSDVLHYSSLDYMKSTVNLFYKERFTTALPVGVKENNALIVNYKRVLRDALGKGHFSKEDFIRKGSSGKEKIFLTEKQQSILDAYIQKKTTHSDVMSLWESKLT